MSIKYDICIIGDLAGNDLILAEHLTRKGLNCAVVRLASAFSSERISALSEYHTHFSERNIIVLNSKSEFIGFAKQCRLILAFTNTLVSYLGYRWLFRNALGLPPVINWHTGSDIFELAVERSLSGMLYRQSLDFAALNIGFGYPHALKNYIKLKTKNLVFLRFPYLLPEPAQPPLQPVNELEDTPIRFFHASHLDWKVTDAGAQRFSSKGNDRFIRAFARAVKEGLRATCVILDRGPDREVAKELIRELGIEDRFIWKSHLDRDDLMKEIMLADVIVDQFDAGGHGGIAIESMAMEKPVMLWAHEVGYRMAYADMPPILNCHTEEQIYEQIKKCSDHAALRDLGRKAREWVVKYQGWETCLDSFVFYYSLLTGHIVVDYGWNIDPYAEDGAKGLS